MDQGSPQVSVEDGQVTVSTTVAEPDTAAAMGSGDVHVLATPRLVALMEWAARVAVEPALEPGQTSVGTSIAIEHVAPSAVGDRIEVRARITAHEGRRVSFEIDARDSAVTTVLAHGTHARVIVDRERFMERASADRPRA